MAVSAALRGKSCAKKPTFLAVAHGISRGSTVARAVRAGRNICAAMHVRIWH